MHIFLSTVLIFGAIIFLAVGLVGVLRDLIERGPYEAPLIEDRLVRPPGYQGTARPPSAIPADVHGGANGCAATSDWPNERESSRT